MDTDEVPRFLSQSLQDRKLSGGERRAFTDWLEATSLTDQQRGVLRHLVFEAARAELVDPAALGVLDWLEDAMKVVAPLETPAAAVPVRAVAGKALFSPGEAILNHLISRFQGARHSVDVCVFTITDDRISRVILDTHRRGVRLRILSDNEKAGDLGSDLLRFREAGIPVKFDPAFAPAAGGSGGHMHHKFAIFDGTHLVNGSYNWTRGAVRDNFENLIDLTDEKLVATFQAEFDRLWNLF